MRPGGGGSRSEEVMGKSQGHGSPREKSHEGCLGVGTDMVLSEDAMKDEGPLAEGSCGGGLEDTGRRSLHSPHESVAEADGGRRPSARCLARCAATDRRPSR
ncbi:hypothetical protein STEG23_003888 [Scotinomys teguina]